MEVLKPYLPPHVETTMASVDVGELVIASSATTASTPNRGARRIAWSFSGRREPVALRSPRFAQARGGRQWPPVERVRSLRCAVLLRPSSGWPSVATRPTHALDPLGAAGKNVSRSSNRIPIKPPREGPVPHRRLLSAETVPS
jgi:hypothetical protein